MKELKLKMVSVSLPNDGYTGAAEFVRLAEGCDHGDGKAMWEMGMYFEQMHIKSGHSFFLLAANFWRYFAVLSGEEAAIGWLADWKAKHPQEQLEAVLDESRSAKNVDGGIFRCLGFLFFQTGVTYDVWPTGNLGVTLICIYPHEDGSFEAAHYEYTYLDEYLTPLPIGSVYFHPDSERDEEALAQCLFPLMGKAVKAAY